MSRFFSSAKRELLPYTPGEQPQGRRLIKLNTNENPYSPSPRAAAAILAGFDAGGESAEIETKGAGNDNVSDGGIVDGGAGNGKAVEGKNARCGSHLPPEISDLRLYSDPAAGPLIQAIADFYGVEENQVTVGNGSDEILAFAFLAFCDPQTPLCFPDLTYGFYPVLCQLFGIPTRVIPLEENFTISLDRYNGGSGSIIIANPNAPTGIALPLPEIEKLLLKNRDRLVMVDEAYVDFGGESAVPLVDRYDNLVVIQTFSKSRSLAGGRVGFAISNPALTADLNRIKYSFNPYNVNRLSMLAAAEAMKDREYFETCVSRICKTRDKTAERLRQMGFTVLPSAANFLFARSRVMEGREYFDSLRRHDILVRRWNSPRIRDFVRISVGSEAEMEEFLCVTETILKEKGERK